MPFKSEAQKKKFGVLVGEGKISRDTYNKWEQETGDTKLPARKTKKKSKPVRSVDDIRETYRKKFGK